MDLLEMENKRNESAVPRWLVDKILTCFYRVYNDLGYGFLEKVYQNALYYALNDEGLKCEAEKPIKVYHNGRVVGDYRADLLVEDCVLLELKSSESLNSANEKQLINYLKATTIEVGYVLNFGQKPQFSRKVFSNINKNNFA